MCEIHKARLLQPCSPGAPPTPMQLSASLAVNSWSAARDLCMSATSFLRLSTSTARSPCRASFVSIVAVKSGNVLLRCNDFRMVGLAVLFLLLGGHQLLQNANDLAALWCVPLTGTARQEKKVWSDHHRKPLFMVLSSQTATSTEVETWFLLPFTRACLLTTLTFRALHGNHIVIVALAVYPRLFSTTLTFRADMAYIMRVMVTLAVHPRLFLS